MTTVARIVHVTSWLSDTGGGIPPVIRALTLGQRDQHLDCTIAGLADPGGNSPVFPADWRVLAGRIVGPAAFGYSPELGRQVRPFMHKDSVIHVHGLWMYPGWLARNLARATGAVRLVAPHGMLDSWALRNSPGKKRLAARVFERQNLRTATCLQALCEAEAAAMRAFGLTNPIAIIPNGIDLPDGSPDASALGDRGAGGGAPPSEGRKTLLYLGRIHPKKGLVNLLRAWAVVQGARHSSPVPHHSNWTLAIAGWDQGGHEKELKQLATELGLAWTDERPGRPVGRPDDVTTPASSAGRGPASVVFPGPQFGAAKAACYQACDAFILPSFSAGLPMVVLEAWAYGKPVLMTPECNLPAGFSRGAAIRIEASVPGMVPGLQALFQAPAATLRDLGAGGLGLVRDQFAWPKITADMKSVYDWMMGGGPRPGCVV
jgi:poly(glycerol-phosphate) alpha-glucosyltransferase